ncbi:diguanylate cyclase [Paenibacillus sp. GCM10028914]|uniref:GGDEF domain-containing protein n=1 Tax=Paenibacillus sp. GCM10028914 TaxID=3273416 RepID=UPI003620E052
MNKQQWMELQRRPWNRKIMNAYWIVVFFALITELAVLFIMIGQPPLDLHEYIIYQMILPFSLLLMLMGSSEFIIHRLKQEQPYLIIFTGSTLASILIATHSTVNGIEYLLLFPMMLSLFYDERRKLVFAMISAVVLLTILCFISPHLYTSSTIQSIIIYIAIMVGAFAILYGLLNQRRDLLKHLRKAIQSEQDLLIRTVIMDRQTKLDALTELYNHKTFHEYLDHLITQSDKYELPLQLAILDIDNFKNVNDTFGHAVGDIILQRVSQVIQQTVLSPDDIKARFGGEEFAVIFTDKTPAQAFETTEQIRKQIEALSHHEMNGKNVTISVGLASYRYGTGKAAIFAEADSMLYEAKRNGKNRTITELQHPAV